MVSEDAECLLSQSPVWGELRLPLLEVQTNSDNLMLAFRRMKEEDTETWYHNTEE